MSRRDRLRQAWTIASLQLRRVFFARRSLWVYILALFPSVAFFGHGIEVVITRSQLSDQITPPALMTGSMMIAATSAGETWVEKIRSSPRNAPKISDS